MDCAKWIIDQLILQGVDQFCIAPGSRSAPLSLAAANHPKANITVHYDERGIGFYALGYGKAKKKPSAIITTSGTAVANLYPAVMEAFHSHTPLIVLTADRPHEHRDCGANQTTDQIKLFNNVIRMQTDLSPHLDQKTVRSITAHAIFMSLQNPQGPVHLNIPFQEPLYTKDASFTEGKAIPFSLPKLVAKPIQTNASRGIILLGSINTDPTPVLNLAKRLGWPVFADLLSNARSYPTPEQIRHFDYLLRSSLELTPEYILHFGDRLISKHILEWMPNVYKIHVSPLPQLQDPARNVSMRIQSNIEPFCETFEANTDPSWLGLWQAKDRQIHDLHETLFQAPFTEAHAIKSLPSDRPIFFGNSMPIRDADHFYFPEKAPPLFANRGVSGIDGNIATMAGIAKALQKPLIGFIGDQTALHDLNSLPLIKENKILLIISNNYGGGIFDYLPQAKSPHLDKIFTASHSWNFENAAKMFNIPYERREKALHHLPEFGIVELMTSRSPNHAFQENLLRECKALLHAQAAPYGLNA